MADRLKFAKKKTKNEKKKTFLWFDDHMQISKICETSNAKNPIFPSGTFVSHLNTSETVFGLLCIRFDWTNQSKEQETCSNQFNVNKFNLRPKKNNYDKSLFKKI